MSGDVQPQTELEEAIAENPEAVSEFVRRLDAVNELLDVLELGERAVTDEMVRSLAETGSGLGELADTATEEETRAGLETVLRGVGAAEREAPEEFGLLGLVRSARDPDVKRGLGYLLAVARAIGRAQDAGVEKQRT